MKKTILYFLLLTAGLRVLGQDATNQLYVHTNKATYLSGEHVWFSIYVFNNQSHQLQKSIQSVYVQLVNANGQTDYSAPIFTLDGRGSGKILLPNVSKATPMRLLFFTRELAQKPNLIFEKKISVLPDFSTTPAPLAFTTQPLKQELFGINVAIDKKNFTKREKVKVQIMTKDVASLSVSVIDTRFFPLDTANNIFFQSTPSLPLVSYKDSLGSETGITLLGIVRDTTTDKLLKNRDLVLVFKDSLRIKTIYTKTDNFGQIFLRNLHLFGNYTVTYQGINKRGTLGFPVRIEFQNTIPNLELPAIEMPVQAVNVVSIVDKTKLDGENPFDEKAIILDEVSIKVKKLVEEDEINAVGVVKLYENPTHSKLFAEYGMVYTSICDMLATVPGLIANSVEIGRAHV